jgi:hypothetical protein
VVSATTGTSVLKMAEHGLMMTIVWDGRQLASVHVNEVCQRD